MSDASKRKSVPDAPKRGDAAWRAAKEAIASRNERARAVARARRDKEYEEYAAERRAEELREQAALARRMR